MKIKENNNRKYISSVLRTLIFFCLFVSPSCKNATKGNKIKNNYQPPLHSVSPCKSSLVCLRGTGTPATRKETTQVTYIKLKATPQTGHVVEGVDD